MPPLTRSAAARRAIFASADGRARSGSWGHTFPLVEAEEVRGALHRAELRIVDATFNPFEPPERAAEAFDRAHLPGATYLALDALRDGGCGLPNMLPTPGAFARHAGSLGITQDDPIVLYDDSPFRTAARAWWMFRMFGVENVWILDGGLRAWREGGHPLTSRATANPPAPFVPGPARAGLRSIDAVVTALSLGTEQIVDARSSDSFLGVDRDPQGLPGGHIEGSINLPFTALLEASGRFLPADGLRLAFEDAGVDTARPITATCGSGVTAAIVYVAAEICGSPEPGLYDGSWSEWSRVNRPAGSRDARQGCGRRGV